MILKLKILKFRQIDFFSFVNDFDLGNLGPEIWSFFAFISDNSTLLSMLTKKR